MSGFPFTIGQNEYLQKVLHLNSERMSQALRADLEEPVEVAENLQIF